jgi:hypothetical protein
MCGFPSAHILFRQAIPDLVCSEILTAVKQFSYGWPCQRNEIPAIDDGVNRLVRHRGTTLPYGGADLRCRDKQISRDRHTTNFQFCAAKAELFGGEPSMILKNTVACTARSKSIQRKDQNVLLQLFIYRHGLYLGDG